MGPVTDEDSRLNLLLSTVDDLLEQIEKVEEQSSRGRQRPSPKYKPSRSELGEVDPVELNNVKNAVRLSWYP